MSTAASPVSISLSSNFSFQASLGSPLAAGASFLPAAKTLERNPPVSAVFFGVSGFFT